MGSTLFHQTPKISKGATQKLDSFYRQLGIVFNGARSMEFVG